ncbi:MAG: hypothetical protein B6V02_00825 [Thermoprotei archaeon ex4572_64]|nr:MAG: hypothetical protein B6V02_00825 [Thermoprotei archaeon ex4572_64]
MHIPEELKHVLEVISNGKSRHIKCKYQTRRGECGCLFFNLKDAIMHLVTHDEKYKRFLVKYLSDKYE